MNGALTRRVAAVGGALLLAAVAAGVARSTAGNSIPDASGVVHACYKKPIGPARIVFSAANCGRGEAPLEWSQTGQPGPQGDPGPAGPPGPTGGGVEAFESADLPTARIDGDSEIVIHSLVLGGPGTYWISAKGTMDGPNTSAVSTTGRCTLRLEATGSLPSAVLDSSGNTTFNDRSNVFDGQAFTLEDLAEVEPAGRRVEVVCRRFSSDPSNPIDVFGLRIRALKVG